MDHILFTVANLLQWSYHGGTPCSVLVGDETSETAAKTSLSAVGNRSSLPRQKPTQSPNGGIYYLESALSRKRRSLDAPHDSPQSEVDFEMHDPVETLTEHVSTVTSESPTASVSSTYANIPSQSDPNTNTSPPKASTHNFTNSTVGISDDVETTTVENNVVTLPTTVNKSKELGGPNHNFYKQNIIRRMQNMILAGHMSESVVLSDLDKTSSHVKDISAINNPPAVRKNPLQSPSQIFFKPDPKNKTVEGLKFDNTTYEFQSDFPVPPLVYGRSPAQHFRKIETIIHPLSAKQIKKTSSNENLNSPIVGSVVKISNPSKPIVIDSNIDSSYRYGEDEVEIFKLENFEEETKKAVDEAELKRKKTEDTKPKNSEPSEGDLYNVNDENEINSINLHTEKYHQTEISTIHSSTEYQTPKPAAAPNPNLISLTLPSDVHDSGKRLFVNVTIATGDISNKSNSSPALNPVYVLSLSLPTGNNNGDINIQPVVPNLPNRVSSFQANNPETTTLIPGFINRGGECQCSCPCLSNTKNKGERFVDSDIEPFSGSFSESEEIVTTPQVINATDDDYDESTSIEPEFSTEFYPETSISEDFTGYGTESSTDIVEISSTTYEPKTENSTLSIPTEESFATDEDVSTTPTSQSETVTKEEDEEEDELTSTETTSSVYPLECPKVTPPPPTVLILEGKAHKILFL